MDAGRKPGVGGTFLSSDTPGPSPDAGTTRSLGMSMIQLPSSDRPVAYVRDRGDSLAGSVPITHVIPPDPFGKPVALSLLKDSTRSSELTWSGYRTPPNVPSLSTLNDETSMATTSVSPPFCSPQNTLG